MVGDLPDSLYREAWEVSSDGLVLFDINGKVRAFDRKFAQLAGDPVTDAAIAAIFPSGSRPLDLLASANPAVTRFCEITIRDGRRLPVRIECVKVQDGLLAAVRLGCEPGSALLNAILDAADTVIAVLDGECRFTGFNRTAEALTGYSAEEMLGKHPWDALLFDEDVEAVRTEFDRFKQLPEGFRRMECRWRVRDGSTRNLLWSGAAILDREGKLKYVVATGIDVTAVRKTEGTLASLSGEFMEAQSAERRAVSGYLHDTISQNLVVLALLLGNLQRKPDLDTAADMEHALRLVDRCCQDLRVIGYALAPPSFDDRGAAAAFDWYSRHLREDARVDVEFITEGVPPDTNPEVCALLLAVIQEWAEKAIRHPDAGKTLIALKKVALANGVSELQLEVLCSQPENEAVRALLASPVIRERVQTLGGRSEAIRQNGGMSARISINTSGVRT